MTDTTKVPELKPCPFCGGAEIKFGHIRDGRCVGCTSCGSLVRQYHPDAEARARQKWNTRADHSDALIAAAYEVAGDAAADAYDALDVPTGSDVAGFVRSLTPADARAALDRVREKALREAMANLARRFAIYSDNGQSLKAMGFSEACDELETLITKGQTKRPRASVSPDHSWEDQTNG
jgi:Lar family restriction alleviation protein